ncbi:MAG: sulfotransferase [Planctomycetota bacterium]|jgi:hypothetical protein
MHFDFQFCSERGGSNLVAKIMDAHPEVCGPFPSHAMRTFYHNYFRYGDLGIDENWNALVGDFTYHMNHLFAQWETVFEEDDIRENVKERNLAAIYRYVYEKEVATQGKKRVYVKENHAYNYIGVYLQYFPESRIVLVVRDPRDMVQCWKEFGFPGHLKGGTKTWHDDQLESIKVYSYLKDVGRMHIVKFEDVLRNTEDTVRKLCSFLRVDYDPCMLRFHERDNVKKNAAGGSAWRDLAKPIMPENCGRYRDLLDEAEIRYIESVCHEEMDFLGYERDYPLEDDLAELESRLPAPAAVGFEKKVRAADEVERRTGFRDSVKRVRSRALYLNGR